nr:EOG090X0BAY [Ilyocryptus agilis]
MGPPKSPKREAFKRKGDSTVSETVKKAKESPVVDARPVCKYGNSCYQKNEYHLKKYQHPHRADNQTGDLQAQRVSKEEPMGTAFEPSSKESEVEKPILSEGSQVSILPSCDTLSQEGKVSLPTPTCPKETIKQIYLSEMPSDFYAFWNFCKYLDENKPRGCLKELLGIELIGPFELLDMEEQGEQPREASNFLTKWRFYYDPPEFQSVIVGDLMSGYHIGYFRDSPQEMPGFVASNTEANGCVITPMADNLFGALSVMIAERGKNADPFVKTKLVALKKQVEEWAKKNAITLQNQAFMSRKKKVVAKTFYQCGIVVPVDKKTKVGYREIPESDADIKKICKKIVESGTSSEREDNEEALQQLVTYVQYANDEMDYGMGLELGLDLLAYGGDVFHQTILHLLSIAYELLERHEYATILKAHLDHRRMISEEYANKQISTT